MRMNGGHGLGARVVLGRLPAGEATCFYIVADTQTP